jgi:hypothetical protein
MYESLSALAMAAVPLIALVAEDGGVDTGSWQATTAKPITALKKRLRFMDYAAPKGEETRGFAANDTVESDRRQTTSHSSSRALTARVVERSRWQVIDALDPGAKRSGFPRRPLD